eukprot:gene27705-7347_t
MGFGKKLVNVGQKARGRKVLRFEIEVIPYFAGELPPDIDKALFAWERGSKIFVTEPEPVNPSTHAVFWKQFLKQTVSLYRDGDKLVKKDCTFKIQSVSSKDKSSEERKTIGKLHIDLSQFCTGTSTPQEIFLQLKPHGKLKVSVRATWIQTRDQDLDALTEASGSQWASRSSRYNEEQEEEEERYEQDLTGFAEESTSGRQGQEGEEGEGEYKKRRRRKKKSSYQGTTAEGEEEEEVQGGGLEPTPFSASAYQNKPYDSSIPKGGEVGDKEAEAKRKAEKKAERAAARKALKDKEYNKLVQDLKKQESMEMGRQLEVHWLDYICCCFRNTKHTLPKTDPNAEDTSLMTARQEDQMKRENDF